MVDVKFLFQQPGVTATLSGLPLTLGVTEVRCRDVGGAGRLRAPDARRIA